MFVGHIALGFVGKRTAPSVSLGWFVAAVTALDLVWPVFVILGWEQVRIVPGATAFTPLVFDSYPWSHSLLMACGWGVALGGLARWLGLWNSIPATLIVEGAMWIAGIAYYLRDRHATRWVGPVAFWSFVVISTVMWASGPWSPLPPSSTALGWYALAGWILIPWAALADRNYAQT